MKPRYMLASLTILVLLCPLPDFITFFRHQIAAIDLQLVRYNFWVA